MSGGCHRISWIIHGNTFIITIGGHKPSFVVPYNCRKPSVTGFAVMALIWIEEWCLYGRFGI